MKISTKGRYALRFMIDLVQYGNGNYISLKDVIARQHISPKYLEQIATALGKAGLIQSVRGPQGGYKLSRQPESYTIGDILRPIEGNLACVACLETTPNECPQYANCTAVRFWEGLHHVVLNYLNSTNLKELADMRGMGTCPDMNESGRQLPICF
ncbi:RrF2 family transcriptional regulator [Oxalobacter paraformigenes]|uniref:Rrf2 family protein n=1 Tax=Oxalobacter paraformigenes TaxID=556268 RepID=C3X3Z1_9BURK|nr:Rrf2 family transcriptional regulator [Oxalobacter paraformigenes]EEO27927.1 Rrf2 family protein [Oxalobacter paraformigenes]